MTDIERYIVEKIKDAPYLDHGTKQHWVEQISKEGLTPTTTRLLLQLMLDKALAARGKGIRADDPQTQEAFRSFMAEIDKAEQQLQTIASNRATNNSRVSQ